MKTALLIVEDDVAVLKLLSGFLSASGFEIYSANSADEAEEILKKKEIKTVLTDIKMPGTDGIVLTKNIKKKYVLDVIVMTAYSSEYSYEDAIQSGASDLLFKPIKLNELVLRINRVLKERSLLDERDNMIKKLKQLTIEDQLTGLFNSRHFFDQLDKEIRRSETGDSSPLLPFSPAPLLPRSPAPRSSPRSLHTRSLRSRPNVCRGPLDVDEATPQSSARRAGGTARGGRLIVDAQFARPITKAPAGSC